MSGSHLLDGLASTYRHYRGSEPESAAVSAVVALEWESPFEGQYVGSELIDSACCAKSDNQPTQLNMFSELRLILAALFSIPVC